jgi:hypothetical protein
MHTSVCSGEVLVPEALLLTCSHQPTGAVPRMHACQHPQMQYTYPSMWPLCVPLDLPR